MNCLSSSDGTAGSSRPFRACNGNNCNGPPQSVKRNQACAAGCKMCGGGGNFMYPRKYDFCNCGYKCGWKGPCFHYKYYICELDKLNELINLNTLLNKTSTSTNKYTFDLVNINKGIKNINNDISTSINIIGNKINEISTNIKYSNKNPYILTNKDFMNGAFIIEKPGYYKLCEDIIHENFINSIKDKATPFNSRQLSDKLTAFKVLKSNIKCININKLYYENITNKKEDFLELSYKKYNKKLPKYRVDIDFKTDYCYFVNINNSDEKYLFKYKNINIEDENVCEISINDSYCVINPYFIGGARNTQNTAAIKIACDNVTIDLNNHSISQSKRFVCEQRVYSIIELNKKVFTNSGRNFEPGPQIEQPGCSNITIKNGIIGRTSHFGIHGTNTNMVFIKNVKFIDFEVSGIWLNNAKMCHIDDCYLSGLTNASQPVCELSAFKTTGTSKRGIVDSNYWGIFLNDTAGQVQRMFATESNRFLNDEPPHTGKEIGGNNKKFLDNRALDGPRNTSIKNCSISDIKSNMIQAKVVARLNAFGQMVPIPFSVYQGAHHGMTMSREFILKAIKDGYDNCKNRYNKKYLEINNAYIINTDKFWDITNSKYINSNLYGKIIVNKASLGVNTSQIEDYDLSLQKNSEFLMIDDFYIDSDYIFIRSLLGSKIKNVKIHINDCKCIETSVNFNTHNSDNKIESGTLIEKKHWNNIKIINNTVNFSTDKFERRWSVLSKNSVSPKNVENKYKIASKCIKKDLNKNNNGMFPSIYYPNNNNADMLDKIESTVFKYQSNYINKKLIQNDIEHPEDINDIIDFNKDKLIIKNNRRLFEFIYVEDNFSDNFSNSMDIYTKLQHRTDVFSFEEIYIDKGIKKYIKKQKQKNNTDGNPVVSYDGDYVTYYIGNQTGLTSNELKQDPCKKPDNNLKTLHAKSVLTIPLVNEMLNGREKFRNIDTDRNNGLDSGGHNMIGSFGIHLERAWGVHIDNININSSMVFNGEGGWGENWWGFMANDSCWNTFKNMNISNLAGNPGVAFGFHLSNGSNSNTIDNIKVTGCICEAESYGITADKGSSSNKFSNCLVSESLGHEFAVGYVIRGSDNTFNNCSAERILLVIEDDASDAADGVSAGFIMDTEDEESPLNIGGNIVNNCNSNAIRVISEREFNKYKEDIYDIDEEDDIRIKDEKKLHNIYNLIQKDFLSASRPLFISNKHLLNTTSAGILIIHQNKCIVDNCKVSNITSHGFSAGILASDKLFEYESPILNTNHIFRNNMVDNIISYNPGIFLTNKIGEVGESKVASQGNISNIFKFNKIIYNPYHTNIWDSLLKNESDIISNPNVVGIGDIRLCDRNRFVSLFEKKETNIDIDMILPCFCSDTLVISNTVTNSYNYWTKIPKSYSFYFKNNDLYKKDNLTTLDKLWKLLDYKNIDDFKKSFDIINNIKTILLKNENEGLLLSEYNIGNIKPDNKNMNDIFVKELYNKSFNNIPYSNSNGKLLKYMTRNDKDAWIFSLKSITSLLYLEKLENIKDDLELLEVISLLNHAEVEAELIDEEGVEEEGVEEEGVEGEGEHVEEEDVEGEGEHVEEEDVEEEGVEEEGVKEEGVEEEGVEGEGEHVEEEDVEEEGIDPNN